MEGQATVSAAGKTVVGKLLEQGVLGIVVLALSYFSYVSINRTFAEHDLERDERKTLILNNTEVMRDCANALREVRDELKKK